jgi:Beta-lactamase
MLIACSRAGEDLALLPVHTANMQTSTPSRKTTLVLAMPVVALVAIGVYVAGADDAPGAAGLGTLLMTGAVAVVVRAMRHWLPPWAARVTCAAGVVVAASVAFVTHEAVLTRPLFAQPHAVPSALGQAPPPRFAAAVERAQRDVRAAVSQQNLPGVSVAVGVGGSVVWAEGFGWRDVATHASVTPATRFVVGTAVAALHRAVAPQALSDTGSEPASAWSPEHVGEPEEDFPPFTLFRHIVFQPLGLMPLEPLPGDRATFYVPRVAEDLGRGRRLMAMRDLGCCADGLAYYSTPSDLVRAAMAASPGELHGALAGGEVMSLLGPGEGGLVVAVTSNLAHANTRTLAARIAAAFRDDRR